MRRALTKALVTALLVLAVALPRLGHAADGRPVLRVVLAAREAPPWFEGFARHLERELGLRGIDVAIVRSERDSATRRNGAGSASTADAELVVEAPTALRPVLRFSVPPRDDALSPEGSMAGRVRQVNLATVPADGCALALAAAADELMRSNWPRAVPAEPSSAPPEEGKAASEGKAGPKPAGKAAAAATTAASEGSSTSTAPERDARSPTVLSAAASDGEASATDVDSREDSAAPKAAFRWKVGLAAAAESFTGGQTQVGPDLRGSVRVLPRLELEVRGGWRRILQQQATNGVVDGTAIAAGGALAVYVTGGARASLSLLGRADLLVVAYSGEGRDASVAGTNGNALGFVVAAGPRGRIVLTRTIAVEGELLAGASPMATTATDTGQAVMSTNGAAVMASLGLSLGP